METFQRHHNLKVTGEVDSALLDSLKRYLDDDFYEETRESNRYHGPPARLRNERIVYRDGQVVSRSGILVLGQSEEELEE